MVFGIVCGNHYFSDPNAYTQGLLNQQFVCHQQLVQDSKEMMDTKVAMDAMIQRLPMSKEKAEFWTPKQIKMLKPECEPSSILCWQKSRNRFQGYYPKPKGALVTKRARKKSSQETQYWTCSRVYGMLRTRTRSQLDALNMVVQFLWKTHQKIKLMTTLFFLFRAVSNHYVSWDCSIGEAMHNYRDDC